MGMSLTPSYSLHLPYLPNTPAYLPPMPSPGLHPWHDIPTGADPPAIVNAIIEIPANERNKYELDKELGIFRLDRVLHSAVHYPGDYGFIPRTLGDDGDPLDVLVMMTPPVFTGCLVECRPIGLFHLIDKGKADEKVIAVPLADPYADEMHRVERHAAARAQGDRALLSGVQGSGRGDHADSGLRGRQGGSRGHRRGGCALPEEVREDGTEDGPASKEVMRTEE